MISTDNRADVQAGWMSRVKSLTEQFVREREKRGDKRNWQAISGRFEAFFMEAVSSFNDLIMLLRKKREEAHTDREIP